MPVQQREKKTFGTSAIKKIFVHQQNLKECGQSEKDLPCVMLEIDGNMRVTGYEAQILGPSKVVYVPAKENEGKARIYIETVAPVELTLDAGL